MHSEVFLLNGVAELQKACFAGLSDGGDKVLVRELRCLTPPRSDGESDESSR